MRDVHTMRPSADQGSSMAASSRGALCLATAHSLTLVGVAVAPLRRSQTITLFHWTIFVRRSGRRHRLLFQMPKTEFRSNAKASMFAYPPALEEKKKEETEKVETAVLSITNKKKQGAASSGKKVRSIDCFYLAQLFSGEQGYGIIYRHPQISTILRYLI